MTRHARGRGTQLTEAGVGKTPGGEAADCPVRFLGLGGREGRPVPGRESAPCGCSQSCPPGPEDPQPGLLREDAAAQHLGPWRGRPLENRRAERTGEAGHNRRLGPRPGDPWRMSWLFPLTKSASSSAAGSPGGLTSLQQQKQRLIESLRSSHSSIAEIQKDVEYRLPFTVNNLTININILLPPQFPQEKPVISVYPPIRHHLMDKQGVYVTSPLVNNFTMHSDLGKIVQSLLDEFWKNPPVLAPTSTAFPYLYSNPGGMPPYASQGFPFLPPYPPQEANRTISSLSVADTVSSSTTSYTTAKPAAPSFGVLSNLPLPVPTTDTSAQVNQNGFGYKMPDVPDAFPELSELSLSQLTDMNEQEEVLLEQFLALPQLKQVISDKDDLVKSIEELARKNLLLEPSLEAKRQTVLDKYELLTQMKSAFEKKMQRQHELSESCSASALQARLKVAAHEAEEESDNIAEDFLEGKTEVDDFLSSFMEKRTICHCRRAKEEKLQQVVATHSQFHAPL